MEEIIKVDGIYRRCALGKMAAILELLERLHVKGADHYDRCNGNTDSDSGKIRGKRLDLSYLCFVFD